MKMILPDKKYFIKRYYKKANEGVLLHELSNIKFRHEELKKQGIKRPFEKEANDNVLKYKLELKKEDKFTSLSLPLNYPQLQKASDGYELSHANCPQFLRNL